MEFAQNLRSDFFGDKNENTTVLTSSSSSSDNDEVEAEKLFNELQHTIEDYLGYQKKEDFEAIKVKIDALNKSSLDFSSVDAPSLVLRIMISPIFNDRDFSILLTALKRLGAQILNSQTSQRVLCNAIEKNWPKTLNILAYEFKDTRFQVRSATRFKDS